MRILSSLWFLHFQSVLKKMCYKDNGHLGESAFQLSFTGFDHSTSGLGGDTIPEQQIYSQNVKLIPVRPSSNAISGSWNSVWNVQVRLDGPRSFFYPVFNSLSPTCCITLTNSTATRLSHLPFTLELVKKKCSRARCLARRIHPAFPMLLHQSHHVMTTF